mmetsp:Transcript_10013/g.22403  ORF Transcript_10013/g.22403 Transcript_10013/m.22403 type:complete len:88 (-) Transcript_10013:201-464(-)
MMPVPVIEPGPSHIMLSSMRRLSLECATGRLSHGIHFGCPSLALWPDSESDYTTVTGGLETPAQWRASLLQCGARAIASTSAHTCTD